MARIHLTGGLRVEGPEGAITDTDLPGPQGRLTLAALIVERRALTADALAEIVWDERPPEQWKAALNPVISKLRRLLGGIGLAGADVITSVGGAYAFRPPAGSWIDLEDALRRLDRAEGALRHGELESACAEATSASAVLRRSFLVGIDGAWVDQVRRRLDDAAFRTLVVLAEGWSGRGDLQLAATAARSAVDLDPLRERGHQALIRAEVARGDRAAARRAYDECERVLRAELDVEPSRRTRELLDG